jgi:predicted NUDIX family NTP pyrophosphohydrolase
VPRRRSAGLVLYRDRGDRLSVLLVHPGGPYWGKKDVGAWSIPKGEYPEGDHPGEAALREFEEELGSRPAGTPVPLGELVQKGGKHVTAFALEGDLDPATVVSNSFDMEWPPGSGRRQSFPEIDRAEWFQLDEARRKILPSQLPFLDRLADLIGAEPAGGRRKT